jgi:drug/metabolite transporter (DMT)-like permease
VGRVALLAGIWGWSFLLVNIARADGAGFDAWEIAFGRVLFGVTALLAVDRIRRMRLAELRGAWGHLALLGLVNNAGPFVLQSAAQGSITTSLIAVLNASTPLFTALIAVGGFGDRLTRSQVVGLVLGFAGVTVASGVLSTGTAGTRLSGVAMMLGSTVLYGFGFNYARRHVGHLPPLLIATGQQLCATLMLLPIALTAVVSNSPQITPWRLLCLFLLGAVGTGIAWAINFSNNAALGPSKASSVTFLVPIVAIALGLVVLDEEPHVYWFVGGAITLVGIALLQERLTLARRRPATT